MKIFAINPINKNNQKNNPRFKALYNKDMRSIRNIPCACCGKKGISPEVYSQAILSLTKPLKMIIQKGKLERWLKNPEIANVLNEFISKYPDESLDKILQKDGELATLKKALIKNLQNNNEDMEDQDIDSQKINDWTKDFINLSRDILKSSSVVMKRLQSFKKYLSGNKLETFEQLEIYAQKYPRKRLSEILKIEEIYKYHQIKDLLQRAQVKEKQNFHFNNIKHMIEKENPNAKDAFSDIDDKTRNVFASYSSKELRMYYAKKMYIQLLEENNCKNITNKVLKELEQIPTSFVTTDSFLIYAANHNFGDYAIVNSLIAPYVSSFEHIVARSDNGEDSIFNGLIMHKKCNFERGSIHYNEFTEAHPEMLINTTKQIKFFCKQILDGNLTGEYRLWPIKVASTLINYTNGKINPDVSDYCQKELEQTLETISNKRNQINQLKSDRDKKIQERIKLVQEVEKLDNDLNEINSDCKKAQNERNEEFTTLNILKNYLNK